MPELSLVNYELLFSCRMAYKVKDFATTESDTAATKIKSANYRWA